MTLGALKKHLAELEEQGATDDSEIVVWNNVTSDINHTTYLEYNNSDNNIIINID